VDKAEPGDKGNFDQPKRHPAPAMTGPLFNVEEIDDGCPAIDKVLASRDRDFNVLATVERQFTDVRRSTPCRGARYRRSALGPPPPRKARQ